MRKAIHILLASWFLLSCYGIAGTNTNDMGALILDAPDFAVWGKRLPFEIELSSSQKSMYPGIPDGIPIHTYRLLRDE